MTIYELKYFYGDDRWFLWMSPNRERLNHAYYRHDGCFFTKLEDDGKNAIRKLRHKPGKSYISEYQKDII